MPVDAIDTPPMSALDATVRSIEHMVVEDYEPGQSLPAEQDLAESLGVSRLTVREALKVLTGRGLVNLGRGRRPVVRQADSSVLSGYLAIALRRDPRGLLELNEIRQSLEVLSASSAARNASRAALSAVEAALNEMDQMADRLAVPHEGEDALHDYNQADVAFHEALALASGNRMLAFILEGLDECLAESFASSARGRLARGASVREVVEAHRAILSAVTAGDAIAAGAAMRRHLREVERDLKASVRLS